MTFESLFNQIEKLLIGASVSELKKAALVVSERYRRLESTDDFRLYHELERLAYIAMRMPATVAVLDKILKELPTNKAMSLLDVGSGPGSALWAALSLPLKSAVCLEYERGWVDIAKKLWQGSHAASALKVQWQVGDLVKAKLPKSDLVIASYCLNELSETVLQKTFESLLEATEKYLVWVEPGTSVNFYKMAQMREWILQSQQALILAPCTGRATCPYLKELKEGALKAPSQGHALGPGWCHFSVRLQRPSFHRLIKDVKMSYEDEKYCYLILEKTNKPKDQENRLRLLGDPMARSGHVRLMGCNTQCDIEEIVVSKKHENYREARKASWGDVWIKQES